VVSKALGRNSLVKVSPEEEVMEILGKDGKESKLEQIVGVDFAQSLKRLPADVALF